MNIIFQHGQNISHTKARLKESQKLWNIHVRLCLAFSKQNQTTFSSDLYIHRTTWAFFKNHANYQYK